MSGRAKTEQADFFGAGDSALARWLMDQLFLRWARACWLRLTKIEIDDADAARLRRACGGAAVLCPNHPSLAEPVVVYDLLRRLGLRANYLVAHDTMVYLGILRQVAQGAGCYSIRRAMADRAAFAATRQLLEAGRAIVMFPEGETYGVNDTLVPFHDGVAQMSFWGLQDRRKAGREGPLLLVPMAVKYLYQDDMRTAVDEALTRLEAAAGLEPEPDLPRLERLRRTAIEFCVALEREYQVKSADEATLNDRIENLYSHLLDAAARMLGVALPDHDTLQEKLRRLFAVAQVQLHRCNQDKPSPYEAALAAQHRTLWTAVERDLARLQTFQAVRAGYVAQHPSAERYLDVIGRIEHEVFGKTKVKGKRRAVVRVGEPLDLNDCWDSYESDRRQAVDQVTGELRQRVGVLVDELAALAPLIEEPEG